MFGVLFGYYFCKFVYFQGVGLFLDWACSEESRITSMVARLEELRGTVIMFVWDLGLPA